MANHPNRGKTPTEVLDDTRTMPKAEVLERLEFALIFGGRPKTDFNAVDVATMPIEELRERVLNVWQKPGVNLAEPKANARLEDQVYAAFNTQHPDQGVALDVLLQENFDGHNLTEAVDNMICTALAEKIAAALGMSLDQRAILEGNMQSYGYIAECLAFDNTNGIEYDEELVDEIAKTAIEAAHDLEANEPLAKPKIVGGREA
jgi:hypothetical protein